MFGKISKFKIKESCSHILQGKKVLHKEENISLATECSTPESKVK
jgi:hypothetical protein